MKTCSRCKEIKLIDAFYHLKTGKTSSRCKDCHRAIAKESHFAHRDKNLTRMKERHKANRDAELAAMKRRNTIRYQATKAQILAKHQANREQMLSRMKAARVDMRDYYLKWLISQNSEINPKDIPQQLIELKREQLATHRLSKQITQAIKAQGAPA